MKLRIAHIVNPVKPKSTSDLIIAQPITFESMRIARNYSRSDVDVELFCVQYPEDHEMVPSDFTKLPDLTRSILDESKFEKERKLPLIADIFNSIYNNSDADYIIYTNVDIGVQPYFYDAVAGIIKSGFDGFCINRRVVVNNLNPKIEDLPSLFSEVGTSHPGFDCFVFKRPKITEFDLGSACIGANWIGRVILSNIICVAERHEIFTDLHLTFHIGDDGLWHQRKYSDYDFFNLEQLKNVTERISGRLKNEPYKLKLITALKQDGLSWQAVMENRSRKKISLKKKVTGKLINFLKKI